MYKSASKSFTRIAAYIWFASYEKKMVNPSKKD